MNNEYITLNEKQCEIEGSNESFIKLKYAIENLIDYYDEKRPITKFKSVEFKNEYKEKYYLHLSVINRI
mgnify:CR=1 FL=1